MSDWERARRNMVESQIRTRDVTEPRLIDALLQVPREKFLPGDRRALAYLDDDVPLSDTDGDGPQRYLMEPMPFARLLHLAAIDAEEVVLDVGCATGYSTAVIARLAASVVALEADADLAARAEATLKDVGVDNAAVVQGPLVAGYPSEAPFDVIVLQGMVDDVPLTLLDQLAEGGRLVAIFNENGVGRARRYLRRSGTVSFSTAFDANVKPLPGFQRKPAFVF